MPSQMKRLSLLLVVTLSAFLFTAVVLLPATLAQADESNDSVGDYVPIGASYQAETLALFAARALQQDSDNAVKIWVLPITYATDPYSITVTERDENRDLALNRANQVLEACEAVVMTGTTCAVELLDIQVRSDAEQITTTNLIDASTDGIFILGGDQTIAMQVTADTPLEEAITAVHQQGTVIGGTSAGAAVQSRYMIGGYSSWGYAWYGLELGALDLWYDAPLTSTFRGLASGLDLAIIDQHVLERGRLGRLMQATYYKPSGQHVGLGADWGTGVVIENGHIMTNTAGWYAAIVLDQETYSATVDAEHRGPYDTLSIQDVAFHILPAGPYGYDLQSRQPIVSGTQTPAPDISDRSYTDILRLPQSAGTLYVTGDVSNDPDGEVVESFALEAQAAVSPTLVIATGLMTETNAIAAAEDWADYLTDFGVTNVQTTTFGFGTVTTETLRAQIEAAGAIFVTGDDQEVMTTAVAELRAAGLHTLLRDRLWRGMPLLLDNAAAAAAGERMSNEPTPTGDTLGYQSSDTFWADYVRTADGLALVEGAVFEPRVMYDYLYGRLVSHVYYRPDLVAIGLERGTALKIAPQDTAVQGQSAVWVVDGRYSTLLAAGENDAMAANWLLLDTYAPGDIMTTAVVTNHILSVHQIGQGLVTQTPPGTLLAHGTPVTLTAMPEEGWRFAGWDGACSGSGDCYVTMTANTAVTATFKPLELHLPTVFLPLIMQGE